MLFRSKAVYAVAKLAQFSFPLVWLAVVERRWPRFFTGDGARSAGDALGFGAIVGAAVVGSYFGVLKGGLLLAGGQEAIRSKVHEIGAAAPAAYVALALFYSVVHSFLEEYYWRGFVFAELRALLSIRTALAVSSLAFAAHHVIVLGVFFRGAWWMVALLSASVAGGGAVWARLYDRSGSLLGPWLSHMLVDASLMVVGFDMLWSLSRP